MTVPLRAYSIHLPSPSQSKTLHHQQQYSELQFQEQLQTSFDFLPFELAVCDVQNCDLDLTLDLGGLNLRIPKPPSSPLTPLTPPDSAADLWMPQGQQYFFMPSARRHYQTPQISSEPSAIGSDSALQLPIHYPPQLTDASPYLANDGVGNGVVADRAAHNGNIIMTSCHPAYAPLPAGSTSVTAGDSAEPQLRWSSGQSWSSIASSGTAFLPSPLRLSQLENDYFDASIGNLSPPDLNRTVSGTYVDELRSSGFPLAPSAVNSAPRLNMLPSSDVFSSSLSVANLFLKSPGSASASASFERSPFEHGSPLVPVKLEDFAFFDDSAFSTVFGAETDSMPTISPQDPPLEFSDPRDGSDNFSLFPSLQQNDDIGAETWGALNVNESLVPMTSNLTTSFPQHIHPRHIGSLAQFTPISFDSSSPGSSGVPLDSYHSSDSDLEDDDPLATDPASRPTGPPKHKPIDTSTGEGTYSCTYHRCLMRFETPSLLQKHKREGHRQAHGLAGLRRQIDASRIGGITILDSQAGPHRCDRVNPATSKPCGAIFSRPYDLTRHEDTIHNARKMKSRCQHCEEEKTFSRIDALRRHYRQCHPHVEIVQKHRRRPRGSISSVESKITLT